MRTHNNGRQFDRRYWIIAFAGLVLLNMALWHWYGKCPAYHDDGDGGRVGASNLVPATIADAPPLLKTRAEYDAMCPSISTSHRPTDQDDRDMVLIIVPLRNRLKQQQLFIDHFHRFMCQHESRSSSSRDHSFDWRVVFVEQSDDGQLFNRGKLLNIGYRIARSSKLWRQCTTGAAHDRGMIEFVSIVTHDVDMLPVSPNRPMHYAPTSEIRHLASAVDQYHRRLPYEEYFGGVLSMPDEHWRKINGFPNDFWGWGSEDDMVYLRLYHLALPFGRLVPQSLGRYETIKEDHHADSKEKSLSLNQAKYGAFMALDARDKQAAMASNGFNTTQFQVEYCVALTDRMYHARVSL